MESHWSRGSKTSRDEEGSSESNVEVRMGGKWNLSREDDLVKWCYCLSQTLRFNRRKSFKWVGSNYSVLKFAFVALPSSDSPAIDALTTQAHASQTLFFFLLFLLNVFCSFLESSFGLSRSSSVNFLIVFATWLGFVILMSISTSLLVVKFILTLFWG